MIMKTLNFITYKSIFFRFCSFAKLFEFIFNFFVVFFYIFTQFGGEFIHGRDTNCGIENIVKIYRKILSIKILMQKI